VLSWVRHDEYLFSVKKFSSFLLIIHYKVEANLFYCLPYAWSSRPSLPYIRDHLIHQLPEIIQILGSNLMNWKVAQLWKIYIINQTVTYEWDAEYVNQSKRKGPVVHSLKFSTKRKYEVRFSFWLKQACMGFTVNICHFWKKTKTTYKLISCSQLVSHLIQIAFNDFVETTTNQSLMKKEKATSSSTVHNLFYNRSKISPLSKLPLVQ